MASIANATERYGTESLYIFYKWYARYHGYVSIAVCLFGVITSGINIIVLTRKNMRNTTNYILTALAVSDMLTMTSYIPFALQFYVLHGLKMSPERNTLPWIRFVHFHVNFTVTTHTISIWLCVILGIFRYAFIKISNQGASCFGTKQTLIAIISVYISSIVILIPNYLSSVILSGTRRSSNQTLYYVASIDSTDDYGYVMTSVNFWIHAIVIKIIPCTLLTVFGILLVCTLRTSNQRRQKLQSKPHIQYKSTSRDRDHSRTTCMLVVIVILFLITELPQGILALFSGFLPGFFDAFYVPLGDLMDIIALINNAINFILYCSMSKQFRDTFLGLFCWPCMPPEKRMYITGSLCSSFTVCVPNQQSVNKKEQRQQTGNEQMISDRDETTETVLLQDKSVSHPESNTEQELTTCI